MCPSCTRLEKRVSKIAHEHSGRAKLQNALRVRGPGQDTSCLLVALSVAEWCLLCVCF
jgi:hypothetical protein